MKKSLTMLAVLCSAILAFAAEPENLIKEPMTISNPKTTVFENGVYTVTNPDEKTGSLLKYKIVLNQTDPTAITFAAEAKAIDNPEKNYGMNFGMYLSATFTDGTKLSYINIGFGPKNFDWKMVYRPFDFKKPVKELDVVIQYNKIKGQVAFRNPQVYIGKSKPAPAK